MKRNKFGVCPTLNRTETAPILQLATDLPNSQLPALLADLEEIRVSALARLAAPTAGPAIEDRLIAVAEAAERLGVSTSYLYQHQHEFPFRRGIGRSVKFSTAGIDSYLKRVSVLTPSRLRRKFGL